MSLFTFVIVNKSNGGILVFYHNYVNQCNKLGMSPSAAAEAMGFKRSMVTRWSKGSQPRQATLQRMADFFKCSVDDLLEDKEKAPAGNGGRTVTEDDIKAAFWGGEDDLPEDAIAELWEDAKAYIAFKTEQARKKRRK